MFRSPVLGVGSKSHPPSLYDWDKSEVHGFGVIESDRVMVPPIEMSTDDCSDGNTQGIGRAAGGATL